jgi:carboxymethylenebutenolidase
MRKLLLLLAATLFALSAFAADGQDVTFKSGSEDIHGMLYVPANAKAGVKLPAMVVIHEWWGLNDWVKEQASEWSQEGYVTLAVDLYRGKVASTPEEAHELMRGLDQDRAVRDMRAAVAYLKTLKHVDAKRIGSIGWCMGGGYSLQLAIAEPTLKTAVINYGPPVSDPAKINAIHAELLGIYGAQDRGIPVADVKAFFAAFDKAGKKGQVKIYDDAGHAFENPNNKQGYRAEDAKDAHDLTADWLAKHLKAGK